MVKNGIGKYQKVSVFYNCVYCDYTTSYKSNYVKHNSTLKHKMIMYDNEKYQKVSDKKDTFICSCEKEYKFSSGLSRHKLVCKKQFNNSQNNSIITETVLQLLKTNQEIQQDNNDLKKMMIEQNNKIVALTENKNIVSVQNIQNNNNVTFNLNYFLNTTCKDAINMKDFIESINVNFNDLENTGKNGFVKSMTHVITRELGKLEACMRPIHCSDVKRKVLHIKNENEWHKDTEQCVNAKKMIGSIAHKTNVLQIPLWATANPRSQLYDDKLNDLYFKIVGNSMEGSDDTYEKIITGVSGKIHVGDSKPHMLLLK